LKAGWGFLSTTTEKQMLHKAKRVQERSQAKVAALDSVKRIEALCDAIKANLKADMLKPAIDCAQNIGDETHKIYNLLFRFAYKLEPEDTAVAHVKK